MRPSTWRSLCHLRVAALCLMIGLGLSCGSSTPTRITPGQKKTCASCHADFVAKVGRGKMHLTSLETRCEECHDRHGLVGVNKLKREEPDLCTNCHTESKALADGAAHGSLGNRSCSACHDPHGSNGPSLLKHQGNDLCLTCHEAALYRHDVAHKPVEDGCLTCHDAHGTTENALKKDVPALCLDCHAAQESTFREAHQGYDVAEANCVDCHASHGSSRKGIMATFVHDAMEDCTMCHAEADPSATGGGAPGLRMDADKLCADCHTQVEETYMAQPAHHAPMESGDCTVCHNPHASKFEKLLVASPDRALCMQCHDTHEAIGENSLLGRSPHAPAAEGKCLDCHDPHAGADQRLLRMSERDLCLSCHADVREELGKAVMHATSEECSTCHVAHGSSDRPILRMSLGKLCLDCHVDYAERLQKENFHEPLAQGVCVTCHDPHGSDHKAVLRVDVKDMCLSCHEGMAKIPEDGSAHAPVLKGECLDCHDPHTTPAKMLLKKTGGEMCSQCHGITQLAMEKAAVQHAPAKAGACLTCHNPHNAPQEKLLSQKPEMLCRTCHPGVFDDLIRPEFKAHSPALEGECLTCHVPHAGDHVGLTRSAGRELCLQCHQDDTPAMLEKHLGMSRDITDCLACHAPHASEGSGLLWPHRHQPFAQGNCKECHDESGK